MGYACPLPQNFLNGIKLGTSKYNPKKQNERIFKPSLLTKAKENYYITEKAFQFSFEWLHGM